MPELIAAIDQGTTSTRCLLFDRNGAVRAVAQKEHRQIFPKPGWVEHDAAEIWGATRQVVHDAIAQVGRGVGDVAAVGITNQRETVVFWDAASGRPIGNAIVWQDTRTAALCAQLGRVEGPDRFRTKTGLPLATYFSGPKIAWALKNVGGLREAANAGRARCGTVDSWLIWNLTGGAEGGRHVTDVTNASRTQLFDLTRLGWDDEILVELGIPRTMLPEVLASSDRDAFGTTRADGPFGGAVPITGVLGDQQAALVGQCGFDVGDAKNTYGTGCFLLQNTGSKVVASRHGLLSTIAYRFGTRDVVYALEGSVAIAGALVQWLRDNLGIIRTAGEIEELAAMVEDTGGAYIVPAFSGLFAPHWRADARGVIVGLTRYVDRRHLARAALEATCFQTREVLDAMRADSGHRVARLKVDGGMVVNQLLMQMQADLLGVAVARPAVSETTALGAAYAAGMAVGFFSDPRDLRRRWRADAEWVPRIGDDERAARLAEWKRAVERTLGWTTS